MRSINFKADAAAQLEEYCRSVLQKKGKKFAPIFLLAVARSPVHCKSGDQLFRAMCLRRCAVSGVKELMTDFERRLATTNVDATSIDLPEDDEQTRDPSPEEFQFELVEAVRKNAIGIRAFLRRRPQTLQNNLGSLGLWDVTLVDEIRSSALLDKRAGGSFSTPTTDEVFTLLSEGLVLDAFRKLTKAKAPSGCEELLKIVCEVSINPESVERLLSSFAGACAGVIEPAYVPLRYSTFSHLARASAAQSQGRNVSGVSRIRIVSLFACNPFLFACYALCMFSSSLWPRSCVRCGSICEQLSTVRSICWENFDVHRFGSRFYRNSKN